jgi:hypothetical protein
VFVRQVVRGELDQCNARLEVTLLARRPINADVEFDAVVCGTMVDFDIGVILAGQSRDSARSVMVKILVDEVQDGDLVLLNLYPKAISPVCMKVNA